MTESKRAIKEELIDALSHPEAVDGLFFCNFKLLHEEDERPYVHGSPKTVANALNELVREGFIYLWEENDRLVFKLKQEKTNMRERNTTNFSEESSVSAH